MRLYLKCLQELNIYNLFIIRNKMLQKSFTLIQSSYDSSIGKISLNSHQMAFLVFKQAIFQIDKSFLNKIRFFTNKMPENTKLVIMNQDFKSFAFDFVLRAMLNQKTNPPHNEQIIDIFQTAFLLEAQNVILELSNYIQNKFDEFGLFLILKISKKYRLESLKKKCYLQLIKLNYQLLNINKYDLFCYDESSFESVLKQHYNLQKFKIIKGLSNKNISEIIKQYCDAKNIKLQDLLVNKTDINDYDFIEGIKKLMQHQQQLSCKLAQSVPIRNRSFSEGNMSSELPLISSSIDQKIKSKESYFCLSLNSQIKKLTQINHNMNKKSSNIISEIKQFNQQITSSSSIYQGSAYEDYFDEKFEILQDDFNRLDKKCSSLAEKFETLNGKRSLNLKKENFKIKFNQKHSCY